MKGQIREGKKRLDFLLVHNERRMDLKTMKIPKAKRTKKRFMLEP
jgi:hypothetical protein